MSSQSISPEERLHHLEGHYADRVTAFRQRLAHLGLSRVLVVLLDIGKNVHWVTAFLASGLALDDLLALYRQEIGRCGPATIQTLRSWARHAVLLPPDVANPLAGQLQRLFHQYLATETLVEEGRGRLVPLLPHTPAPHLPAIPGLGEMDAAAYLATVGSIHRFQRAAEVWAFVGYDPISDGSGDRPELIGHLSKHGDSASRDSPFQMGYRVAQNYAPVSLTFLDAFDRGKCEVEATIHAAHRVNRICFHLMYYDEPFENRSTPQMEAEKARRWRQFQAEKKRRGSRRTRGKRRTRRRFLPCP